MKRPVRDIFIRLVALMTLTVVSAVHASAQDLSGVPGTFVIVPIDIDNSWKWGDIYKYSYAFPLAINQSVAAATSLDVNLLFNTDASKRSDFGYGEFLLEFTDGTKWKYEKIEQQAADFDIASTNDAMLRVVASGGTKTLLPIDNTRNGETVRMNITIPDNMCTDKLIGQRTVPVDVSISGVTNTFTMGGKSELTFELGEPVAIADILSANRCHISKAFNGIGIIHESDLYSTAPDFEVVAGDEGKVSIANGTITPIKQATVQTARIKITLPERNYGGSWVDGVQVGAFHYPSQSIYATVTIPKTDLVDGLQILPPLPAVTTWEFKTVEGFPSGQITATTVYKNNLRAFSDGKPWGPTGAVLAFNRGGVREQYSCLEFVVNESGFITLQAAPTADNNYERGFCVATSAGGYVSFDNPAYDFAVFPNKAIETRTVHVDVPDSNPVKVYVWSKSNVNLYWMSWTPYTYASTIAVSAGTLALDENDTSQLTATASEGYNGRIVWTSSDTDIAKVDANGLVTAVGGGTATITATAKTGNNTTVAATCTVTVNGLVKLKSAAGPWSNWREGSKNNVEYTDITLVQNNKVRIYATSDKKVKGADTKIELGGTGKWSSDGLTPQSNILEIWVGGSGYIKAKTEKTKDQVRYLDVANGNQGNIVGTIETSTTAGDAVAKSVLYNKKEPAHLFIYSRAYGGINLTELAWEPCKPFPTIEWSGKKVVGYGKTVQLVATALFEGQEITSGTMTYTVVSESESGTVTLSKDAATGILSVAGNKKGTATIKATFTDAGYSSVSKDFTVTVEGKKPVIVVNPSFVGITECFISVGSKSNSWETLKSIVRVYDDGNQDITNRGTLTFVGDEMIDIDADGLVTGKYAGYGRFAVTWTPLDEYKSQYEATTSDNDPNAKVRVDKGRISMTFVNSEGIVAENKHIAPSVKFVNSIGNEVLGLTATYTIVSSTPANCVELDDEGRAVRAVAKGTATVRALLVNDKNYEDASTVTTFSIRIDKSLNGKLDMIEDKSDYTSPNLADYWWYDETSGDDNIRNINTIEFTSRHPYISGDEFFRVYPSSSDDLVNTEHVKGLYLKESGSYLEFKAKGSATLKVDYYAVTSRRLEIYAVNADYFETDANGKTIKDPTLNSAGVKLVGTIDCKVGANTGEIELKEPGKNFYFIKTAGGGIFIQTISWTKVRMKPELEITPNEYSLNNGTSILQLGNAYDWETNDSGKTTPDAGKQFILKTYTYNNNNKTGKRYDIENPQLTFSSDNPDVADVDPVTGLVTPNSTGDATIYFILAAGITDGIPYGALRTPVTLHVKGNVADVFFYDSKHNRLNEYVHSGTKGLTFRFIPTVTQANTNTEITSGYSLTYRLTTEDGTPLSESIAKISNAADGTAGTVTVGSGITEGTRFRVVVDFESSSYVNQHSFYTVEYTTKLTKPALDISCPTISATPNIKEMKRVNEPIVGFDAYHEYFAKAGWWRNVGSNHDTAETSGDKLEYPYTFTFTIPTSASGITMYAKVTDTAPTAETIGTFSPSGWISSTNGRLGITVSETQQIVPNAQSSDSRKATQKYVVLYMTDGTSTWNSYYKINFVASPKLSHTGDKTSKTVSIASSNRNSDWPLSPVPIPRTFHYTLDTTEPNVASPQTDKDIVCRQSSVVLAVEKFTLTIYGVSEPAFTDNSQIFITAPTKTYPVDIEDKEVFYVADSENEKKIVVSTPETRSILNHPSDDDIQVRAMFGVHSAHVWRKDRFRQGGVTRNDLTRTESSIFSQIDKYESYVGFGDNRKNIVIPAGDSQSEYGVANPYTEYNQDVAAANTENGGLYLTPMSGDFFRFEPEYNGVLSVWVRQNGATASGATSVFESKKVTDLNSTNSDDMKNITECLKKADLVRRPVYVMDEDGVIMQRNSKDYTYTDYLNINGVVADVSQQSILGFDLSEAWRLNLMMDSLYTADKTRYNALAANTNYTNHNNLERYIKIMKFYANRMNLNMNEKLSSTLPLLDIVYCDNTDDEVGTGGQFAKYGFEIPNQNYVRYRFPVKAGKTYYIGGRGTKNAFSAMKFEKHGNNTPTEVVLDENGTLNTTNSWLKTMKEGALLNVKLKRKFTKGHWHPIVLPFSVSESRMKEIFGDNVMVITLDKAMGYAYRNMPAVQNSTLVFTHHFYQMLYAGVPAFICPSKTMEPVHNEFVEKIGDDYYLNFNRVTFASAEIEPVDIGSNYKIVGSYETTKASDNNAMYFIDNGNYGTTSDGKPIAKLCRNKDGVNMRATRCWIKEPNTSSTQSAQALTRISMASFSDDSSANATSIEIILENENPDNQCLTNNPALPCDHNIYSMEGIAVGTVDSDRTIESICRQLAPGVYLYQNKKLLIK